LPPAQIFWYEAQSKPVLISVQPLTARRKASAPGKQKLSSPSVGRFPDPNPSESPAGQVVGLPLLSRPNGLAGTGVGPLHPGEPDGGVTAAAAGPLPGDGLGVRTGDHVGTSPRRAVGAAHPRGGAGRRRRVLGNGQGSQT
jgi:hypothetical protein